MIKAPKLYFTDVGVASTLLGIENENQMMRDPAYGNLVENLIFLELMKSRFNEGRDPRLYFFRDISGKEVDFIYQSGHELIPIEVKGGRTFHQDFLKNLQYFQNLAGNRCQTGYLIYAGAQEQRIGSFQLLNYKNSRAIS